MTKSLLLKTCKFLLATNIILWLIVALYSSLSPYGANSHFVIKILLFFEPVSYSLSYIGVVRKIKTIYLFSIVLALGNVILSITDQVDYSDIASLILSFLTFLSLISIWKHIYNKQVRMSN